MVWTGLVYQWYRTQGSGRNFNIGNIMQRLAVVNQESQSEASDGPTSCWRQRGVVVVVLVVVVVVVVRCSFV